MTISIRVTGKIQEYIKESLKDNDIDPTRKNINRVLRGLKDEVRSDFENIIDDVTQDIARLKKRMEQNNA